MPLYKISIGLGMFLFLTGIILALYLNIKLVQKHGIFGHVAHGPKQGARKQLRAAIFCIISGLSLALLGVVLHMQGI